LKHYNARTNCGALSSGSDNRSVVQEILGNLWLKKKKGLWDHIAVCVSPHFFFFCVVVVVSGRLMRTPCCVCRSGRLLLALASTIILGSEFRGTIFYCLTTLWVMLLSPLSVCLYVPLIFSFSVLPVSYQRDVDYQFFLELLVIIGILVTSSAEAV
jgi:hypothetical protein